MKSQDSSTINGWKAFTNVKEVLTKIGWDPKPTETEGQLRVDFKKEQIPIIDAIADIKIEYERFLYYLNFKKKVPPKYRAEVMGLIARINFDLFTGSFDINLENGHIRYRSSIDFTSINLSKILIGNIIKSAKDAVEYYADALEDVITGKLTAAEAMAQFE